LDTNAFSNFKPNLGLLLDENKPMCVPQEDTDNF